MTNKKPFPPESTAASQHQKLDAATLSNMAHEPVSPANDVGPDSVALVPIAEMLSKLSLSNLVLVENIIRVIIEEQERGNERTD